MPEEATVHFFRDRDAGGPQVISPTIDGAGNLDVRPEGFFDQFDKDMNHFAGWETEVDFLVNDLLVAGQFHEFEFL